MGNPSQMFEDMCKSSPFNVHTVHNLNDARFIAGEDARNYIQQFMEKYEMSIANCVLTTIAGSPGSGKSYMFSHLTYQMANNLMPGIPVLIRLGSSPLTAEVVYKQIRSNQYYRQTLSGISSLRDNMPVEILGKVIRNEIQQIRNRKPGASVCLFIDNVDEYIRSEAIRLEKEQGIFKGTAREKAMENLLRVLFAVNDSINTGVCTVLSLTIDMIDVMNLNDPNGASFISKLVGTDVSMRRRFSPIYKTSDSAEIHSFGALSKDEAFEMISVYMTTWFERNPTYDFKFPSECAYKTATQTYNVYPFHKETISLIHESSKYPGEIVLGCLSTLQRFNDLLAITKVNYPDIHTQYLKKGTIEKEFSALGILQMSSYFNMDNNERRKSELANIIRDNPVLLYIHILPQIVERIKLEEKDYERLIVGGMSDYIGRIGLEPKYFKIESRTKKYLSTRGRIKYPQFPTVDCSFYYKEKLYGIQFLTPNQTPEMRKSKIKTICDSIQSRGTNDITYKGEIIDNAIFICVNPDSTLTNNVIDEISTMLIGSQYYFHSHVAIVTLDEKQAWDLCAFAPNDRLSEVYKDWLAQLIEENGIDYHYWVEDSKNTIALKQPKANERRWDALLSTLHKGQKIMEKIDEKRKFNIKDIKME
jgi:hypothetical protein